MNSDRRVRLEVFGRVQGVFFRASTKKKAKKLGVYGWVRNRPDGSVEAVAEGHEEKVEALVQWAKSGPKLARVDNLEVHEEEVSGEFDEFEVRR